MKIGSASRSLAARNVLSARLAHTALLLFAGLGATTAQSAEYVWHDDDRLGASVLLSQWWETVSRHRNERALLEDCLTSENLCDSRLRGLRRLLTRARGLPLDKQLKLVNYYVNRKDYRHDRARTIVTVAHEDGQKLRSQWRTLLDFVRGGGDCEDYASTKYFLMRELGVPVEDMRIVVTYERASRSHHAVLAVRRPDREVWLLEADNTISKPPHRGYRYVYALNEDAIWDHRPAKS